jgi:hypothetical protein
LNQRRRRKLWKLAAKVGMSSIEANIYSANDMSVGDLDGDKQYELIVKWDLSNSKDNSLSSILDLY